MKNKNIWIRILVLVSYVGMVTVNALANILPINGITTAQVSDSYPNLFAPAGLTFSIWGVIYTLLAIYTIYQLGIFQKDKSKKWSNLFDKIGNYFIVTSLANIFWIFFWHYNLIPVTVLFMVIILFFLIKIAELLNKEKFTLRETLLIAVPFRVYFGWITVATIANITAFLVSVGFDGFGISNEVWTIIILIVGAIIGIWRMIKDKSIAYGLVLIWAYFGIWFKHISETGYNNQYQGVITTVMLCIVLFFASNGYLLVKKDGVLK